MRPDGGQGKRLCSAGGKPSPKPQTECARLRTPGSVALEDAGHGAGAGSGKSAAAAAGCVTT